MKKLTIALIFSLLATGAQAQALNGQAQKITLGGSAANLLLGTATGLNAPHIIGDLTSGLNSTGAATINTTISGTKRLTVNATGANVTGVLTTTSNVGIGTNSPSTLLHISADIPVLRIDDTHANASARNWAIGNDYGTSTFGSLGFFVGTTQNGAPSTTPSVVFTKEGNVGIGTTAPGARLDILESGAKTAADYGLSISNTATSATDSINKYGLYISSTGTWSGASANNYGLYVATPTGGTANYVAYFKGTTGNVQIGTDSTVAAAAFKNYTTGNNATYTMADSGNQITRNIGDASPALTVQQVNASSTGDILQLKNNASTVLVVQQGGNVGIGTTAPGYKTVIQAVAIGAGFDGLVIQDGAAERIRLGYSTTSLAGSKLVPAQIQWGNTSVAGDLELGPRGNVASSIEFFTSPDAGTTGLVERMRVNANGDVGIGTTSPLVLLHVSGSSGTPSGIIQGMAGSYGELTLRRADGTVGVPSAVQLNENLGVLNFSGYKATGWGADRAAITGVATENWTDAANGTELRFHTTLNGAVSASQKMVIANNGNVGIGTGTPAEKLDVYGAIDINGVTGIKYPAQDSTANGTIAIGSGALANLSATAAAYSNTAIGYQSQNGTMTTAAIKNTTYGYQAGAAITTGSKNTAMGYQALLRLTTGSDNIAIGVNAAQFVTAAASTGGNTAIGDFTCGGNGDFFGCTANGKSALAVSTGNLNTAFGYNAGLTVTSGINNVVIGPAVASTTLTTGSSNILIGASSAIDATASSTSNELKIGNSSTPVLAATGINGVPATTINGTVSMPGLASVATAVTGAVCWNTGGAVTYNASTTCLLSSIRYKNFVRELPSGLDEVMRLRPVIYTYKNDQNRLGEQVGFIAEDVEKVDRRLVAYNAEGQPQTVRYENAVAVLAKAIQEQQQQIDDLKKKLMSR